MTKTLSMFVSGVLIAAVAEAGTRYSLPVSVGSTYAYGSIGDARRSADALQYIGCSTSASATLRYATCFARDATGAYGSCRTYDDHLIRVAETVGSDSVVDVRWSGTTCTSITVTNDSRYAPRES